MSTFIIGEAGSAHNGEFDRAIHLIDIARDAGCNAVKFQLFKSLYNDVADFGGYTNIKKMMERLEMPRNWVPHLKKYCDDLNIEFMATPFDEEAIDILVNVGVKRLKIAAFESSDGRFMRLCARTKLPLIVSLGVKSNPTLVLNTILDENPDCDLTLLHCVSSYPTKPEDACLLTIKRLKDLWKVIGYSDHTTDTFTPALAVALGATVIEKHFCNSRLIDNPDCKFSLEPAELQEMVKNIRETELKLKYRTGNISSELIEATRAIYAKKSIKKGEEFTEDNITTLRPYAFGNTPASEFFNLRVAEKDYEAGDPI